MAALSDADHDKVSAAVAAAEARSDGEIVTILTDLSDPYHDVGLHWAVAVLIAVLAWSAFAPGWLYWAFHLVNGGWSEEPTLGQLLAMLMFVAVLKFTIALLLLKWMPLRLALTPGATKQRRVRRRAVALFKAAAERRTIGRTGVLLYLSLGERRAEIVADQAIHEVTTPECWGEAMAILLADVKQGRPADGIAAAVGLIGDVLAEHFPKTAADINELPDKLIEL
ncbi:hypothetical protein HMF7854_12825 [Sphingomonas ginkgonis]|uniref:TPM domain-containing protein n=1 Tax=Sphingomonas ginkgonis TaxID=2315330 RepID=A0A3R9WRG5_9SPHN|nr:hypothetical protein [Sphingomonas ginkgonis]RST31618.1 hypothetical protein HMF7854_12825 [Sphingomonas ginkgonis]